MKNGGVSEVFKRKRKSLALKTRSVSSMGANMSRSREPKPREGRLKLNKSLKTSVLEAGVRTPKNYSVASLINAQHAPKHLSGLNNGGTTSEANFHFTSGFLTRPKPKSNMVKIEKELSKMVDTLKVIREELNHIKAAGSKIDLHESKIPDAPIVVISENDITSTRPHGYKPPLHHVRSASLSPMNKKLTASKSQVYLALYKGTEPPSRVDSLNNSQERASSADKSCTEKLVKKLIGQLSSNHSKNKNQSLEDFVNCLSTIGRCKSSTVKKCKSSEDLEDFSPTNKHSIIGDHHKENSSSLRHLRSALRSLFLTTSAAKKKFQKKPRRELIAKGVQTETNPTKNIAFSNINLSKTVEEMIKKVIIESKTMKYVPHSLPKYFEEITNADKMKTRRIADGQKQALFNSVYALLQKQLLVEVTLEMIKDSGVNVQNLFQFTFNRIGLDYEKYVHFENQRDQDMSAREIFEGELECSLIDDHDQHNQNARVQELFSNNYTLDFHKIQTTLVEQKATDTDEDSKNK